MRLEAFREHLKKIAEHAAGKEQNAASIVDVSELNATHQHLWETYGRLLKAALEERPNYPVIENSARVIAQEALDMANMHIKEGQQSATAFCALLRNRLNLITNNIPFVQAPQYKDEIKAEWKHELDSYFGS